MNTLLDFHESQTRRQFFHGSGLKLGGLGLAMCMGERMLGAASSGSAVPST